MTLEFNIGIVFEEGDGQVLDAFFVGAGELGAMGSGFTRFRGA